MKILLLLQVELCPPKKDMLIEVLIPSTSRCDYFLEIVFLQI